LHFEARGKLECETGECPDTIVLKKEQVQELGGALARQERESKWFTKVCSNVGGVKN